MDLNQILKVLKAAAKTVQDIKATAAPSNIVKSNFRDSYETILEQYCIKNRFQWSRDATGNIRNSCMHHIVADFFRLDIHMIAGVVADVWVLHELRGHRDVCPQIARALRLKDMSQFDVHMNGFLKMYTTSADKAKRLHFFMSLNALENDLTLVQQHLMEYHMEPMELVRSGPFGLMVPRLEGMPFSLGFFVAPSDLMERNGSFMKKEYHVIAGRRLGLWASICVKASKGLSATLPMSTVYRKMTPTVDGNIICDFATVKESGGHDVPGSFVLALDQPMVLMESAITEIKQITDLDVQPLSKTSSSGSYIRSLRSIYLPYETKERGEDVYRVILPGQHHVYTLLSGSLSAMTTSDIPFSHPSQIPPLLNVLRRQAALNKLLSNCMRVVSENEVIDPFAFRVTVASARLIAVEFSHPLNSSSTKVEIRLDDMGTPSCELVECNPRLCRDQQASVWLNKTFSIPVVLKTMIDRFVESYIVPSSGLTRAVETSKRAAPVASVSGLRHLDATPSCLPETASRPMLVEGKIEPTFTPTGPISPVKASSKIERMLKEGKSTSSPNFVKDKSSLPVAKDIPMDQELHAKKMKELYDTNPKKKLRKPDTLDKEVVDRDAAKLKKRRASVALTPPGSVPLPTLVKTESQDFGFETQPKSEPPITKIRTARTDSPHGSPITLKFSTVKQPSTFDSFNPSLQTVLLNKDSPPKKKKIKLTELPFEQKHMDSKLEAVKKVKRDVFDFDAGSELKEVKKIKKDPTEPEIISIEPAKKSKKEQLAEVDFLPKGNKKKDTDLSELASLLSKNKNNSSFLATPKTSPSKPSTSTSPSSSSHPRQPLVSSSSSSKYTSSGPAFSSSKFSHKDGSFSSKSSSQVLQIFQTSNSKTGMGKTATPNASMQFSVPKSLPSGIGRIPKKNHGGIVALPPTVAGGAPRPMTAMTAALTPKAIAQLVVAQVAPPSSSVNRERVEETSSFISALLTPSPSSNRAGLLPTPSMDSLAPWNQYGSREKSALEKVQPPSSPKTPTPPTSTIPNVPEKPAGDAKQPSLFRQVMGNFTEVPRNFTEVSPTMSSEDEKAKKSSPDASLADTSASSSIKSRSRSISAILDRLSSKTRLDTADGSHDSSDLQDTVFNQLSGVDASRPDVVTSPEVPPLPNEVVVTSSEEPEKEEQTVLPPKSSLTLQTLVAYSSDDDASCDDAVLVPDTASTLATLDIPKEVVPSEATVAPPPQSPEVMEQLSFVGLSEPESTETTTPGPLSVTPDVGSCLSPRHSDDRTSPIILNDEMLDAAFFTSDEKD